MTCPHYVTVYIMCIVGLFDAARQFHVQILPCVGGPRTLLALYYKAHTVHTGVGWGVGLGGGGVGLGW